MKRKDETISVEIRKPLKKLLSIAPHRKMNSFLAFLLERKQIVIKG